MSNVVSCACGKKLRLPEGSTARAVRCPGCQSVLRLDGATTAAKSQAPSESRPAAPPAPRPAAPKATVAATPAPPATAAKPAGPPAAQARTIQDPPNVWLYVTDPDLIARAEDANGGRKTSLRTFGPSDDPLSELAVPKADDVRAYLGKGEYIAWIGRPSEKHARDKNWIAWGMGGVFAALGLGFIGVGLLAPVPDAILRIVLPIFGLVFGGAGTAVLVMAARGIRVVSAGTGASNMNARYILTNRRAIVWVNKSTVRSFTGPMVMNMRRQVELEHEDEDYGSLMFGHGLDDNPAGAGFCDVEKVSEVEELVRGYLIDRVLEKSAAGDGPRLAPMEGPNPFAREDGKKEAKGPPKKLELWQAAALALEAEKELTPEMIAAARKHTERVLKESMLADGEAETVREHVQPGETIVWVGRPDVATVRRGARFMAGAALVFLGLAVVVLTVVWFVANPGKDVGGVVFYLLAGVGVVTGTVAALLYPSYEAWKAGRTFYVLTSRRALTWVADWKGAPLLEEYGPRDLSNLHVVGKNVVFRTLTTVRRSKQGAQTSTQHFGFLAQKDAPAVERLVRETLVEPFLEKAYE